VAVAAVATNAARVNDPSTIRRLYGRRAGHKLRQGQAQLIEELLPQIEVPDGPLSSEDLFGDRRPLHFEIGFGSGEHLGYRADLLPDHGFIGAEPFLNHGPLDLIAGKLAPGGEFRFSTDHPIYCRWAMMIMHQRSDFRWIAESARDMLERPGGWPETRYEAKARRLGHEVWYFRYQRV
jgi:tRNA (guanine-N7-)-methyltransferase